MELPARDMIFNSEDSRDWYQIGYMSRMHMKKYIPINLVSQKAGLFGSFGIWDFPGPQSFLFKTLQREQIEYLS